MKFDNTLYTVTRGGFHSSLNQLLGALKNLRYVVPFTF
jgi:hypothetical protein